jgi:hypothetical protein
MGTSQLYFLHIPKTAGSSITRLLEDSWPAGAVAPYRFVDELEEGELERYEVISGHHGTVPATGGRQVVTLLRDPVRRAWSHYRALGPGGDVDPLGQFDTFQAVLDDPVYSWIARDYQARWLAIPPAPAGLSLAGLPPGAPGRDPGGGSVEPSEEELEAGALAMLRRCALAGTVERVDDFVEALGRLVGRPLAAPPRLNVGSSGDGPPVAEAARVRELSPIDVRLHGEADAELDRALATLPELPPEPRVELPYRHTMSDPLYGTGWHARVDSPEAGWHRWTGPGVRSELRLPVRAAGPARVEIAILSACDDDAVLSLRLEVQGRPVEHSGEPRGIGVAAIARVELDPRVPLTLALEVAHTRHLVDAATGARSPDPAGLAIGDISLGPLYAHDEL